jgi:acyl-CoA reductase-like NAD-dependent aldehyde dehydrogenase
MRFLMHQSTEREFCNRFVAEAPALNVGKGSVSIPEASFGLAKVKGVGGENGMEGLAFFLDTRTVQAVHSAQARTNTHQGKYLYHNHW